MTLYEQITEEMKAAMKAGDKDLLSTIRMVISSINYTSIDKGGDKSDELVMEVLTKEAKKRRESIEAYESAGREELAQKEKSELEIISRYLPTMLSEDEVEAVVREVYREGMDFGSVMRESMVKLKGRADGKVVSQVVKRVIESK